MTEGSYVMDHVHSVFKYSAPRNHNDSYDDTYIGFMGDRAGAKDPPMVKVNSSRLEWRKATPIANAGDNSPIEG